MKIRPVQQSNCQAPTEAELTPLDIEVRQQHDDIAKRIEPLSDDDLLYLGSGW
jgi:hypothetical protein